MAFSEHIQPLRHASFTVDGGEVTGTRRVDGRHDLWRITVEPDSDEDVTITLPGDRECGTAGAVCTRGNDPTPLMNSLSATVAWDSNTAATGTPTISGTPQVGETLTVDTSGIADEDGLENVSYSYRWLVKEGTTVTHTAGWTDSTFTLADAVEGKAISVQVSFSDDAGNEESLIGVDAAAWSATMTVEWVYQGYGYYSTDVKEAGSLSPDSFNVDGTTYTVKMVETKGWWMYIGLDRELPFDFVLELDGTRFVSDDASFRSYSYGNIYRWEGKGLSLRDGDTVEVRLLRAFDDETAVNSVATGAPTISGTVQVGETLMADTSGIADEDGLTNADFTYQWLADDTEIQGATNADYTLTDADEGKTIKVQVSFTDNADNDETLTSTATDEVAAATAPNSPATGAPAITGTAQVGETLTADTSGIADEDGLDNVLFSYQWLADDTAIQGATNSTYTLADADEGNAIKVQVTFTDDADNEETLTSTATVTVAASTQPNSPATGAATISGTVQVGGTLTADTSGISDDDRLDNVSFSYQWLADDTVIQGATNSTYTLADADEGKAIKVHVSFTDNTGNDETLTSAATAVVSAAAQPNNPATSAPTVSGTAQVGETLTADTSGIADADGLTNATFTYQWLADDTDIAGATGSTYTLVEADEGKTVKVRVSFTDDAGNGETLTSEATDPVTATTQPNSPATGAPTIRGTVQVGETLTADTSGIADEDRLDNASFSYQWLADDDTISGATNSTYTLVDADAGKSISVRVSFTDDADNEETLTSVTTDSVTAAPEPPAQPTGLSSTVSHDTVTLNWEDPNDDSITGYVILRRDKEIHEEGTFVTVEDDTESADNTYTDDTVEPSKQYVYRIKAINAHGLSEISSWVRAYTPATSEPPAKPTGLSATATHDQAVLTWDNPGDDGITGYVILRRNQETDAEGEFTELVSNTGSADTTYSDESVVAETRYTYRIKAINEHGVSERSRWFHIDTPAAPVPAKPTGLSATATHDQVTLTWDDPNDDSIDGYVILRRNRDTDAKGEFTELVADTGSAHTTYSDDTVAAETRYTYRIKAINEHGVSERSRWFHLDTSAAPDPEG